MSIGDQSPPALFAATPSLGSALRAVIRHRGVQTTVILWVIGYAVVLWLAHGSLPFDRPAIARLPFAMQMAAPTITMIEIFVLMVLAFLLTRKRVIPDMAARAPERRIALRETVLVLAYATLGQVGGWIVGPGMMKSVLTLRTGNAWVHAFSYHAFAPHMFVDTPLVVKTFGIA
jgi:hypothetical protein